MKRSAIVIGAGVGGLAVSIRLQAKGYQTTTFDTNPYPGGKLCEIRQGSFRFDAGPSLFTLPHLVDELYTLAGLNPAEHFIYEQLPISCHYFWEDGTRFQAPADSEEFVEAMHARLGVAKAAVRAHLAQSARLYKRLSPVFMQRPLNRWETYLNTDALKAYASLPHLDFFRSMNEANTQRLQEPHALQLFNRYATYNGSNPYQTPATFNIIPHLEMGIGTFFPKGGMQAISRGLFELAEKLGVQFRLGEAVDEIVIENGKAVGIRRGEERMYADVVVSNADMVSTYRRLLPERSAPEKLLRQPKSSSALIFYWGMKELFPELHLHNIFFSNNYPEEFRHIFELGSIYHDPTVYINITSKLEKNDAPEGCENWFVMINVPNNQGQDWNRLIAEARKAILKKLSRMLGEDIEPLIVCEQVLEPRSIEQRTSSWQGALYGNSSNNRYAAFLRHANQSRHIKNLYFCGGSVHPGGGIPLCLLSARITADLVP